MAVVVSERIDNRMKFRSEMGSNNGRNQGISLVTRPAIITHG